MEDLTASHWDDVYTATHGATSNTINILESDEFAPPTYDDQESQESKQEEEPSLYSQPPASPGLGDYNDLTNPVHPSTTQSPVSQNDNASTEATKSVETEVHKQKNQTLLSSLTKDIDDLVLTTHSAPTPPATSGTLFGGTDDAKFDFASESPLAANDNDFGRAKSASAPIKMFRSPRARRNKKTDLGPLGPLKPAAGPLNPVEGPLEGPLVAKIEPKSPVKQNRAETIVKSADAPLYEKKLTDASGISSQVGEYFSRKAQAKKNRKIEKPEPEVPIEKLEVNVGDPTKVGDITSAHIVYTIRSASDDTNLLSSNEVVVTRRYKDFRWLYHQLQANHPGIIIPPPPIKQVVGRFSEQFIESRRAALEVMVQKIAASPLQSDPDFLMFLQSSNFASESKERERITGSGASSAPEELDGSAGGGSFMSALGGAFSFGVKVTDQDEFFLDQKAYIEDLDMHLRSFLRNFELIVQQRTELSSVTEEFANAVQALAQIETSKSTTDLLAEFAHVNIRIKELLTRQSMQDLITLGSVLDEYIRLLGSIRSVFSQRHKLLAASVTAEGELNRKQVALEKFIRNHRNQVDRIELMKKEVGLFEEKHNAAKAKFDAISETIKKELNKFEYGKIEDFRNAVETFLEGLIESQKEAIEVWETFYERQKLDDVETINLQETDV